MATEESEVTGPPARVTVTDVDISFSSMVWLLVKLVFAAIPAAIIVFIVAYLIAVFIRGIA